MSELTEVLRECRVCGLQALKESDFINFISGKKYKYGKKPICIKCNTEKVREWKGYPKEKTRRPAGFFKSKRDKKITYKFGLRESEFDLMLDKQGGGCWICGVKQEKTNKSLCIDHDHKTGDIRGILCSKCNTGLGMFNDSALSLKKAIRYLEK